MKIRDLGEFGLINRIAEKYYSTEGPVTLGIGDDASLLSPNVGMEIVTTTDMLVEDVHFTRVGTPAGDLGYKALAVNLSDLAAMGAKPIQAFISLAIPGDMKVEFIDLFYEGFMELANNELVLSGGDTVSSTGGLIVSVTLIGEVENGKALKRDSGTAGDKLYVSGNLGNSAGGLALLLDRFNCEDELKASSLVRSHNRPIPEIELGRFLVEKGLSSCAIDISDGLIQDLGHICRMSMTGATVDLEHIPMSRELIEIAALNGTDPLELALNGGEDYCLLFTVRANLVDTFNKALINARIRCFSIGYLTEGEVIVFTRSDRPVSMNPGKGHDHFRG